MPKIPVPARENKAEELYPRQMARRPAPAPEQEAAPVRSRVAAGDEETASGTALIAEGRQGAEDIKDNIPSPYPLNYTIPDIGEGVPTEPELIKFVPGIAVPTVAYAEHWVGAGTNSSGWITEGKRSYVCLGENCPLCDIGDTPRKWEVYNVLDLRNPAKPLLRMLKAAKTLAYDLMVLDKFPRTNPPKYGKLAQEDMYWKIWRINNLPGDKGVAKTQLQPVPKDELLSEWGFKPLNEDQLAEWTKKAWSKDSIVQASTWADLKACADKAP